MASQKVLLNNLLVNAWIRETFPSNGNTRSLRSFIHRRIALIARITEGFRFVALSGKLLLKMVASRLSNYCEAEGILPEEQCSFLPARSTVDVLFVVRRLQELGRARNPPLYMCFIDLQNAYDSVDRELLWVVPARFGVCPREGVNRYPPVSRRHASSRAYG